MSVQMVFSELFKQFAHIFASSVLELGCANVIEHEIRLTTNEPIYVHPYQTPITRRPILENFVKDMIENGVIRKSKSPFSSPVVLVKKKCGNLRFCVNYIELNKVTVKDRYPLPRIDAIFDCLFGAKFFSTLDLFSGFWQIMVKEDDREKTAFTCEAGHY